MQVTGTIVKIKAAETIPSKTGGKDFVKREIWLELPDDKYPQTVSFELTGDRVSLADAHQEGQEITVEFNLRGRIWQDKCFNTLSAWRIIAGGGEGQATPSYSSSNSNASTSVAPAFEKNVNELLASASDDLPF